MTLSLRQRLRLWLPPLLWAGLILVLTNLPARGKPLVCFPGIDKLAHAILFAVLSFLLYRTLLHERPSSLWTAAFCAFLLAVLYGAMMERFQLYVPNRAAEALDVAADAVGAAVVFVAASRRWGHARSA